MTSTFDELLAETDHITDDKKRAGRVRFLKWLEAQEPDKARLYCRHEHYIGNLGVFRYKCEECNNAGTQEDQT